MHIMKCYYRQVLIRDTRRIEMSTTVFENEDAVKLLNYFITYRKLVSNDKLYTDTIDLQTSEVTLPIANTVDDCDVEIMIKTDELSIK
jgi:hypothetical protein